MRLSANMLGPGRSGAPPWRGDVLGTLVASGLLTACIGAPLVPDPAEPVPPALLTPAVPDTTRPPAARTLTPAATATTADAWAVLRARPVQVPTVVPGSPCPVTPAHTASPDFPAALGSGPVYPVGLAPAGVLYYGSSAFPPPWQGQKVLWIADPTVRDPVLVRGHQLDGPNELRFADGADPPTELPLDPTGSNGTLAGWNNWPTYTRVRAPGCYAYQVDGLAFSEIIVFEARDALPPRPLAGATPPK